MRMIALLSLAALAAAPAVRADPPAAPAPRLGELVATLGSGDQRQFAAYFERRFAPASLAESPAEERADRMARLYADTHGFTVEQIVASGAGREVARVRARLTGMPYCLTVAGAAGSAAIMDFSAVNLPSEEGGASATPPAREVAARMGAFMDRIARGDEFSGVILITRNGRPVLRRAYGRASQAYPAPITFATRFNVASIGKSLTGVAIGQLVDAGRLRLDQRVGEILPDYPDAAVRDRVTVRQLLNHSAGLGDSSDYVNNPLWPARRSRLRSLQAYIPLIQGQSLATDPGTHYAYSNVGYVILGLIVERIAGQSFYDYVHDNIFARAGMRSSFYHELDAQDPNVATPLTNFVDLGENDYRFRLGPRRDASPQLAMRGGSQGGAFVTADDLMAFLTAALDARLTTPETARRMTTSQGFGRRADIMTGLGFEIVSHNGHHMIGHTGGDIGVSAFFYRFVEDGYAVVVLSNYDARAVPLIFRRLRDLIARRPLGPPQPPATCA